jgi:2-methylcitrate dehydratase PrpD
MPGAAWDVAMAGGNTRDMWTGFGALVASLIPTLTAAGYHAPMAGIEQALRDVLRSGFEPERLEHPLHDGWAVENNYHKRFSCVGFIPPVIEAMEQAIPEVPVDAARIRSVEVDVPGAAERLSNRAPQSAVAARFSIPFCIAVYLTTGRVYPVSFTRDTLDDVTIRSLCERVSVREGKDLPHPYSNQRSARVTVTLVDGSRRSGYCPNARGDYSNPLTDDELSEKFARVTAPIFGRAARRAADAAWNFPAETNVKQFIARLAALGKAP